MSMLFSRKALIPVWLVVVFGLFALFGPAPTSTMLWGLLFVGVVPPVIMLVLFKEPSPSVAEIVRDVDASRTE